MRGNFAKRESLSEVIFTQTLNQDWLGLGYCGMDYYWNKINADCSIMLETKIMSIKGHSWFGLTELKSNLEIRNRFTIVMDSVNVNE